MIRIALLLTALTMPAQAYVLLEGPMPSLTGRRPAAKPIDPKAFAPAPRPNVDLQAPAPREPGGLTISPGLTNRNTLPTATGSGYAPGSAYSDQLGRRNRSAPELGSVLAPSLNLRLPLQ